MQPSTLDAIVIGAGQAGLGTSYYLTQSELSHLVFERGKIGHTWTTQRWDSFKLNSINKVNSLPGKQNDLPNPNGFCTAAEFVSYLRSYADSFQLPVRENCEVISIEKPGDTFSVNVNESGINKTYYSHQVIIASGGQNKRYLPSFAENIPGNVLQLHTCEYRNASTLPEGNILVVGSAQSGTQVADDLAEAGRKVFLSTSKVGRVPRFYRGKDIIEWIINSPIYTIRRDEVTDPEVLKMKPPQVSGVGPRGRTSSLQSLARKGVIILGRAYDADNQMIFLQPNAAEHVRFGDEFSKMVKSMIDQLIEQNNIPAPEAEYDADDVPDEQASCVSNNTELDLAANNITSIIWTTGFTSDFSYLKLPVVNEDNTPMHHNGLSEVEGLYFIGLPWLITRRSALIAGVDEDARFISEKVKEMASRYKSDVIAAG